MNLDEVIKHIKERIDISQYVMKEYNLPLIKSGDVYKVKCVFHEDSNPSLVFFPKTCTYKCFGCGEHGDVIEFVSKYESISKKEAIIKLCKSIGISVNTKTSPRLMKHLKTFTSYCNRYIKNLQNSKRALDYLINVRKLNKETLNVYGIGYVTNQESAFREEFYIRDRISFPIIHNNFCVGMGYRGINQVQPKYINDKNTDFFTKGDYLYGLHVAQKYIKQSDFAIVTEGYTDPMYLHQSGIKNSVSVMGTAFTENQMKLLSRYTKNILLFLDNDEAGNINILRVMPMLLKHGFNVKIIINNDSLDPGDLCIKCNFNKDEIINYLNANSRDGIKYLIDKELNSYDEFVLSYKKTVLDKIFSVTDNLQGSNKLIYENYINKRLDL